jgi:hypothetical protein
MELGREIQTLNHVCLFLRYNLFLNFFSYEKKNIKLILYICFFDDYSTKIIILIHFQLKNTFTNTF